MLVRNPLNRSQYIRVNDNYDNQDIVVENAISKKKKFTDLSKVSQLTQNSWNMSPFTRESVYKDISVSGRGVMRVTKYDRYRGLLEANRYHEHR